MNMDLTMAIGGGAAGVGAIGYMVHLMVQYGQKTREERIAKAEERLGDLQGACNVNAKDISALREEVHANYVHHDHLKEMRTEQKQDFGIVFERLNDLTSKHAELIGYLRRHEGRER